MSNHFKEVSVTEFLGLLGDEPEDEPKMPKVDFSSVTKLLENAKRKVDYHDPFVRMRSTLAHYYFNVAQVTAMTPYLKQGWVLVNTSQAPNTNSHTVWGDHEVKPAMSLYASMRSKEAHLFQASEAEMFGEFKTKERDEPFRELSEEEETNKWRVEQEEKEKAAIQRKRETAKETRGEPPTRKRKRKPIAKSGRAAKDGNIKPRIPPFERESKDAADTRGQLALYINAIQAAQQRTRVFAFYVRKERCRLLCHSRSGTLVTP
jgi:hypothetical protein